MSMKEKSALTHKLTKSELVAHEKKEIKGEKEAIQADKKIIKKVKKGIAK